MGLFSYSAQYSSFPFEDFPLYLSYFVFARPAPFPLSIAVFCTLSSAHALPEYDKIVPKPVGNRKITKQSHYFVLCTLPIPSNWVFVPFQICTAHVIS